MPEIEYVYSLWDGKLERSVVVTYDPATETMTGRSDAGVRFATVIGNMYFKTPEEAVREDYDSTVVCLPEARQEVQDALASYREIKRIAKMSFEDYLASISRTF